MEQNPNIPPPNPEQPSEQPQPAPAPAEQQQPGQVEQQQQVGDPAAPGAADAEPAGSSTHTPRLHAVDLGEKLGEIAATYLGDAKRWAEIAFDRADLPEGEEVGPETQLPTGARVELPPQ